MVKNNQYPHFHYSLTDENETGEKDSLLLPAPKRGIKFWFKHRLLIEKPILFRGSWSILKIKGGYCYLFPTTCGTTGRNKAGMRYLVERTYFFLFWKVTWKP